MKTEAFSIYEHYLQEQKEIPKKKIKLELTKPLNLFVTLPVIV